MPNTTSSPLPAAEAARIAAARPAGGKHRLDGDPVLGGETTGALADISGRHADLASTDSLLLDACVAAEMLAQQSESWTSDQILAHSEIAQLAFAEAAVAQVPAPKPSRLRRRRAGDPVAPLRRAAQVLAEARTRITFVEA